MTEAERNAIQSRALLLYDGVCVLCNGVVQFLFQHDHAGKILYAPLQSELGREILARFDLHGFPDGVVLLTDALMPSECLYQRSDAVAMALQLLGASWGTVGKALGVVPLPLRDWGYGIVARFRYRLFGRSDACPVPSPELRSRVLGL